MKISRDTFRSAVENSNRQLLFSALANDVIFRHPLYEAPIKGKIKVAKTLGVIGANRGAIHYLSEANSDLVKMLEFHIQFGSLKIHGTDILKFNKEDEIVEISITMRPLPLVKQLFDLMHPKFKEAGIDVANTIS